MQRCASVQAIAGRGLEGDRYWLGEGTFSHRFEVAPGARSVSLIDTGCLAQCEKRLQCAINPSLLRRNLLVDGPDLMTLRGWTLCIGEVRLELLGSCPPCGYLSRLLGMDMRAALHGIGGMRARIISGGLLTQGQPTTAVTNKQPEPGARWLQ